jgi:hypothetical protein
VYFLLHRQEIVGSSTPARGGTEQAASGGRRTVGAREDVLTALQREAATKLAGAARERCLADPRECLAMLKALGAESSKRGVDDR